MSTNQTVALLFGGQSAEHEVSLSSAANVRDALVSAGYRVLLIGIDRHGVWRHAPEISSPEPNWPQAALLPGCGGEIVLFNQDRTTINVDVVFPVLHGPFGEDGTMQGLLKLANVPFVGPGVLASALCMDKTFTKRILEAVGIPTVQSLSVEQGKIVNYSDAVEALGPVLFVKPANMGSSVGVSKVDNEADYETALVTAFRYDTKVLVESFVAAREIECAVLSAGTQMVSLPGEIVPTSEDGFYSYDAKYVDADGATLVYPADLSDELTEKIRTMSLAAFRALNCEGMARVDFFLTPDGEVFINELNTIPGFTAISMYPKLWDVSGVSPAQMAAHLIEHALYRFNLESGLEIDANN